jgi:branched-chain amino acid transport system permease protein
MDVFIQQLINGITLGSIYGLIAIGYTMVFGIIGMVNFAHGDVFMVSVFISLIALLILTSFLGVTSIALALLIVLLVRWSSHRWSTGPSSASPTGRCAARSAWRR